MKDRKPTYPGRVKLTKVSGTADVYDMVRYDSPEEEGTPINKATLLTDETAALFDLPEENATPNKALEKIGKVFPNISTKSEIFTDDGMFLVPKGVTTVRVLVYGGGGGGGAQNYGYNGGGGGGYWEEENVKVTPGEFVSVTIGAGGAVNQNGGVTSFGTYLAADGGAAYSGTGKKGGDGGSGGGGAGGHRSADSLSTGGSGGNGKRGGGGGGGGSSIDDGTTKVGTNAPGGSSESGGAGGKGSKHSTFDCTNGADGVDTTALDILVRGEGKGGLCATTAPATRCGAGGGGGGGYGGNGGRGGVDSEPPGPGNAGAGGGGGGGGGYGGNGGDGGGDGGFAGKGGYGYGAGGGGSVYYGCGGGGGGGGYSNFVKLAKDGGTYSSSSESYSSGSDGAPGICVVTYTIAE